MKRVLCAVLAAGVVGLVGCGSQGTSTAPSKPGQTGNAGERRKLVVTGPSDQSVTQNGTEEMTVSVKRENFTSPVKIELSDLPKGVSVVSSRIRVETSRRSGTYQLSAWLRGTSP